MITKNRILLVAESDGDEEDFRREFNYEAISIITTAEEIEETWKNNKTPIIPKNCLSKAIQRNYPILEIPQFIFGKEDFIAFCHRNGFECGEYVSNEKTDTSKEKCFLCAIANKMGNKGPSYIFNSITPRFHDMIIYESEHFFVKIEYGCLKKGMVMICPKQHIMSAANIPEEQMDEYRQVMKDTEFILKATYGDEPVIFFEHGANPNGFSSHKRSIVHAHVHVAWGIKFPQKYLDMVCLQEVRDIKTAKNTKYFSYQEGSDGKLLMVTDPNVYVQRQYPRQVIGELIGIENEKTNWRKFSFTKNMKATFRDFYMFLKRNQGFLSDRIVKATECFVKGYPLRSDSQI